MVQIYATTQGRDLGAVASDIRNLLAETAKDVPRGSSVAMRNRAASRHAGPGQWLSRGTMAPTPRYLTASSMQEPSACGPTVLR